MEIVTLKAKALVAQNKYDQALQTVEKNKKSLVDDLQRNDLLANIYQKLDKREAAIECLENLLELNSCNYETFYKII